MFIEKSLVLKTKTQGHSVSVKTEESHLLGTVDSEAEKWSEPFSRQGFTANIFLMRTAEGTTLTGFKDRPRGICSKL